ncbi:Type 1 glutamine amidotransferase-like domain-containing protein [Pseudolysinimonas sp.]|jgi:dipeptidase E|uniref:Type 1 glutamine amidotransferase-like domain-containing protein n=1 Tax=Pseudolysinimonas sp. TaxID=2680009 RepID=UPI003783127F
MRMLLTSHGIRNAAIRAAAIDLIGRPTSDARIIVVVDAILPFAGDKSKLVEHLAELQALGWAEFDVVSLLATPRHLAEPRLEAADVILGYGGSNLWLAHAWISTGLAEILPRLLEQKVYVGWSAGSMIFSRLQEAAVEAFDDDELEVFGLDGTTAAAPIFDWFLMPHLGADYFPDHDDAWAARHAPRLGGPVWFLDDDSALLVRDPAQDPEVVSQGRWLRFDASGGLIASA